MVKIDLEYLGELRMKAQHGPSRVQLQTDAPIDNQGKGESFSPTDLVATGLGSCMATVMGILARRQDVDLRGMRVEVEKVMSQDTPRRIAALKVHFQVPVKPEAEKIQALENAAHTCPVAQSLHPDIKVETDFIWGS